MSPQTLRDVYVCRCRVCPACGDVKDRDDDSSHPFDGLASCYARGCRTDWHVAEWWVGVGPFMDGVCPGGASEAEEWAAHDLLVMLGRRSGYAVKRGAA